MNYSNPASIVVASVMVTVLSLKIKDKCYYCFLGMFILGVILLMMQRRTSLGKSIYAIGGNEALAEQAGINVARTKISVFCLAGCLYGIAAFFLCSRLNCANPTLSKGFLYPAIRHRGHI